MARRPLTTLAAADDPNVLHRILSQQLAEHRAVLAERPPGVSRELGQVRHDFRRAEETHKFAVLRAAYAREQLEHHNPLTAGTERLREARATYAADIDRLGAGLPPDAADRLRRAEAALCRAQEAHGRAALAVKEAEQGLMLASQRRWGRIDGPARDAALRRRTVAAAALHGKEGSLGQAGHELAQAQAAQALYEQALAATASERQELSQAVADLDAALERTRPERALAQVHQEVTAAHLVEALGPFPEGSGPRAV